MRRSRRCCLPVLLLVTAAAFGASAVTLKRRDSLDLDWGGEGGYYRKSDGVYCQKCPAGTYIAEECKEQNSSGRCEPCRLGEYMEYPNALGWCQDCSECREDQVKQSPCQPVRNTLCVCRNGTFCPPDHPCEMCQKCRPRCPDGQVELKPCTPHSDLLCGPDTATWPYSAKVIGAISAGIGVIAAVILLGLCWKHGCSSPGDGRPSSSRPCEIVSSMFGKLLLCKTVNVRPEDNSPAQRLQPYVPGAPEMLLDERPMTHLVPAPGQDPSEALRRTFYTFAEKIPLSEWMKFGRSLNLQDNDINMALRATAAAAATTYDGFYNMLCKWQNREGSRASVNTLLDTLVHLDLGGVAEEISVKLVNDRLFQFETS